MDSLVSLFISHTTKSKVRTSISVPHNGNYGNFPLRTLFFQYIAILANHLQLVFQLQLVLLRQNDNR